MISIQLTKNQHTIVDEEDFNRFGSMNWCASFKRNINAYYAVRKFNHTNIFLHREIMNAPKGRMVDHINHDTLDNRKSNLRICSQSENQMNRKGVQSNSTSGIRGVYWRSRYKTWEARIGLNKKMLYLGSFKNISDAILARKIASEKYHGNFMGAI